MSESKRRIVVVENQISHFREIEKNLHGYEIYPKIGDYVGFINNIRIFLNLRFSKPKSDPAKEYIFKQLRAFEPELFIIDYILVGNHSGERGTDLGIALAEEFKVPIIFLSRTERNAEEKIQTDLKKLRDKGVKTEWVTKGFAGVLFLDRTYFKEHVIDTIDDLLSTRPETKPSENEPRFPGLETQPLEIETQTAKLHNLIDKLLDDELLRSLNYGNYEAFCGILRSEKENATGSETVKHVIFSYFEDPATKNHNQMRDFMRRIVKEAGNELSEIE